MKNKITALLLIILIVLTFAGCIRCIECAYSERYAESRNLYECKVDKMIMRKNDYCSHGEPKEKGEE